MKTFEQLQELYSEADFLQPEHVEKTQRFIKNWTRASVSEFTENNMNTYHLGQKIVHMLVHTPHDPSDQVIVVPGGYATGHNPEAVIRAMAIREVVDPHATLLYQANVSPTYLANNFSNGEEQLLDQGDLKPMRDRINLGLDEISRRLPDARAAYSGGSFGGGVAGSVLGHAGEMMLGTNGGTIVDPANITSRNLAQLSSDYLLDLPEMTTIGRSNFHWRWWRPSAPEYSKARTLLATARVAVRDAVHIAHALEYEQLSEDLMKVSDQIGLVHMWSKWSHVSPDAANLRIAGNMRVKDHPRYHPVRITHPRSRHGVTVSFPLQAAALEHAINLSEQ